MTQKETITVKGTVVEALPNKVFRVELANKHNVLARAARDMKHLARILPGDCVVVEMSPSDSNRGRLISRC